MYPGLTRKLTMDFNLLFQISLRNIFRVSIALLLLILLRFALIGSIVKMSIFLLIMTSLEYWYYQYYANQLQIKKGDENYLRVNFSKEFTSDKNEQQIIQEIQNFPNTLGKVKFGDQVIRRFEFPWPSEYSASLSKIEKVSTDKDSVRYKISTKPLLPWIKYDFYHNLRHFEALSEIIKGR